MNPQNNSGPSWEKYVKSVMDGKHPDVVVEDKKIIDLIGEWTKSKKPIKVFRKILKQIGVEFPIKLKDISEVIENRFICETAYNRKLTISLYFGSMLMYIKENNKTSCYNYSVYEVSIELESTEVVENGVKLYNRYLRDACYKKLILPGGYELQFDIFENCINKDNNTISFKNANDMIGAYLLSIKTLSISEFDQYYEGIRELCNLSNDMSTSIPILFDMALCEKNGNILNSIRNYGPIESLQVVILAVTC